MCPDCHHEAHKPGQCESCNCGESEVLGLADNVESLSYQNTSHGWVDSDGYRVRAQRPIWEY